MSRLHHLKIQHFRGIENFEQTFSEGVTCIIGRGDSGKSTILDAISYVFSSYWTIRLNDSDFYRCDISVPIIIEGTVASLPEGLKAKYDTHIRGVLLDGRIIDDMETPEAVIAEAALTIRLTVLKDLEPVWEVVSCNGMDPTPIKAIDREMLNVFLVSDYTDRHFSMNKGNPLYGLYRQMNGSAFNGDDKVLDVIRAAKNSFDSSVGNQFDSVVSKIREVALSLGISLNEIKAMMDYRDIAISDNRVSIHEDGIPFRLKGKGSKRLLSLAIQLALTQPSGIILIDEIEQGLEPDRVQHLVSILSKLSDRQIIITTHSSNVVVELPCSRIFLMREGGTKLLKVRDDLQGAIRKNPEAFFAKRVLVCEGATEIGICRAINQYRIDLDKLPAACLGVRFADGAGKSMFEYACHLNDLQFDVALFCDSDDNSTRTKKVEAESEGVFLVDCEDNFAIEQQAFKDIPWAAVREMVDLYIGLSATDDVQEEVVKQRVIQSVNSKLEIKKESVETWLDNDEEELRKALGSCAKANKWFKRQDYGQLFGEIIMKYYQQIPETKRLKREIASIIQWIDA